MGTWRERLAAHLDRYEISRAELARLLTKSGISTSRSAITKWLNEGQDPGVETFAAICRLTGQSADSLLGVGRGSTVAVHAGDLALAVRGLRESGKVLSDYLPPEPPEASDNAVQRALAELRSLPLHETPAQAVEAGRRARALADRRKKRTPRDRSK